MSQYALVCADVLEFLRTQPENAFDGLLCDPPYGLSFMGKKWDYDVPSVELWAECLRVLKPGAPLLAFGGARTFHRITCGIEDAGFEIRDVLMWLYAKGFPKSLNVGKALDKAAGAERPVTGQQTLSGNAALSLKEKGGTYASIGLDSKGRSVTINLTGPATDAAKQWDGYGTALKPAYEPVILARKPLDGTVAENVTRWGVGALAIDACRVGDGGQATWKEPQGMGFGGSDYSVKGNPDLSDQGRWPANLILDEGAAEVLDEGVGPRKSGVAVRVNGGGGQIFSDIGGNGYKPKPSLPNIGYMDGKTNPSRFFFTTKVGRKERERGCEHLALKSAGEMTDRGDESQGLDSPRAGAGRTGGARNHHPTLKPIALTEYLARLIKPPTSDAVLLVPFAGAGSEVSGALKAGWPAVLGIEREAEYVTIAEARIPAHVPDAVKV